MKNRLKVLRAEWDWTHAGPANALEVSRQIVNASKQVNTIPISPMYSKTHDY